MKKRKWEILLFLIICIGLNACKKNEPNLEPNISDEYITGTEIPLSEIENEDIGEPEKISETGEISETKIEEKEEYNCQWNSYDELICQKEITCMALIYLDKDNEPELLTIQNGEYHIYYRDKNSQVFEVKMPENEIKAQAYGYRYGYEDSNDLTFYWFAYVPFQGLLRVYTSSAQEKETSLGHYFEKERHDYYLQYSDGFLEKELEIENIDLEWHTYDRTGEISNEMFLSLVEDKGYNQLIPCAFLYQTLEEAYDNINRKTDTKQVWQDFVNGKINAMVCVKGETDNPRENFETKSYKDILDEISCGEEEGRHDGIYRDFDNDGEDEMIIYGYVFSRAFLDVIGDTVYLVLETSTTTDVGQVAVYDNEYVIERTDTGHVGREYYMVHKYDSCGVPIVTFRLSASYGNEDKYSEDSEFKYRGRRITMQEFERIRNKIQQYK